MRKQFFPTLTIVWLALIAWNLSPLYGQKEFHGADSVFEKEGITILWAILKGPTEGSSRVYIKILNSGNSPFQAFSVEAVDPFSKEKEWVVRGEVLKKENLVKSVRTSFTEKTGRRVFFYKNAEDLSKGNPATIVYYFGIPDTSPEFLTEREMENYFEKALRRLIK
jgi:hypothetical protein